MKIKKVSNNNYVVLLVKGESLIDCLKDFHKQINFNYCTFNAIGAITDVSLGFAFLEDNEIKYNNIKYKEEYELLSLTGNIALKDNDSVVHAHATLSDLNNNCLGGHINSATISIVCEMIITVYDEVINKVFDKEIGIAVLDI